ncbi:hypothetical protein YC2023_106615 [Brassica napus]
MADFEKQLGHKKHHHYISTHDGAVSAYRKSSKRAIFLDYDGTLVPETSIVKDPSAEVMSALKTLCTDPNNTIFIVSGRGKVTRLLKLGLSSCHQEMLKEGNGPDFVACIGDDRLD